MTSEAKLKNTVSNKDALKEDATPLLTNARRVRAGCSCCLVAGFLIIYLPVIFDSISSAFTKLRFFRAGITLNPVGWANTKKRFSSTLTLFRPC